MALLLISIRRLLVYRLYSLLSNIVKPFDWRSIILIFFDKVRQIDNILVPQVILDISCLRIGLEIVTHDCRQSALKR